VEDTQDQVVKAIDKGMRSFIGQDIRDAVAIPFVRGKTAEIADKMSRSIPMTWEEMAFCVLTLQNLCEENDDIRASRNSLMGLYLQSTLDRITFRQ